MPVEALDRWPPSAHVVFLIYASPSADDIPPVNVSSVIASDNCDPDPAVTHVGDASDGHVTPSHGWLLPAPEAATELAQVEASAPAPTRLQ